MSFVEAAKLVAVSFHYVQYTFFHREISALLPILEKHNVRLIGIGLEPIGAEEFIQGDFFKGGGGKIEFIQSGP